MNQIARLEDDMPRAGSEGYLVPSEAEMADFAQLVAEVESGDLDQAAALARQLGYNVERYVDTGDQRAPALLLLENRPVRRGWGLYVFRAGSTSNIVVEAPHPLFDGGTPALALSIYRALHARALLVAGAHRHANADGSADVTHSRQTVFEAAHAQLTAGTQKKIVLQIHGFSSANHPDYPDVVVNAEGGGQTALVDKLVNALQSRGVQAASCDGVNWLALCGEDNLQSQHMQGGTFIHLELDESVRVRSAPLLAALIEVMW